MRRRLVWEKDDAMTESCPLPSGRDCVADAVDWKGFVDELLVQWRTMWRERIDDKVKAEGISNESYDLLFVDRGTVIIATRCFKQLDFKEILERYDAPYEVKVKQEKPPVLVGGWRRFGRDMAARASGQRRSASYPFMQGEKKQRQQLKKGGRGWLHFRT